MNDSGPYDHAWVGRILSVRDEIMALDSGGFYAMDISVHDGVVSDRAQSREQLLATLASIFGEIMDYAEQQRLSLDRQQEEQVIAAVTALMQGGWANLLLTVVPRPILAQLSQAITNLIIGTAVAAVILAQEPPELWDDNSG